MRPLPTELLRSFVIVAETANFTVASERIGLSQSTVSQHIRRLEDLVGVALFERDTRNVRLTRHGEALHRYAVQILKLMDEAMTTVCGPPLNGTVRLGLPEDFALSRLAPSLASFAQRNREVELVISTGLSGDLFRELDENKHDLVFAKRLVGSQRGYVVSREQLYWCGSPTSALTGGESILPLAVHPEPSVTRTRIFETLKAAGRSYRVAVVSSSIAVIQAAVTAGLGISAFRGDVIPQGLIRLTGDLPDLGVLEYVIDRKESISQAAAAVELIIADTARLP
jgi:DNA-binding transcriptional LysR family regulator